MWIRGERKPPDISFHVACKQQVKEQIASTSRQVLTLLFDVQSQHTNTRLLASVERRKQRDV